MVKDYHGPDDFPFGFVDPRWLKPTFGRPVNEPEYSPEEDIDMNVDIQLDGLFVNDNGPTKPEPT